MKPYLSMSQRLSTFPWEKKKKKENYFLNQDKISVKTSEIIRPIASIIQFINFDSLEQAAKIYGNHTKNHSGIAHLLSKDKFLISNHLA